MQKGEIIMWMKSQNIWKRNSLFYITPSIFYYQDSGFVEEKSLTIAWLCWQVEIGTTLDYRR